MFLCISKSCAERCRLLRLMDQRYKGIAQGIGQTEILGRIHVAPIKKDLPSRFLDEERVPNQSFSETQEERHVSAVTEESVGETKPKESDDTSTKETNTEVDEMMKGKSLSHALEQVELKDLGTIQPGAVMEDQDSVMNENSSDDFTFSKSIREAEHGDENSSTLPVVGILKELQTTLEEKERGINSSEGDSCGNDLNLINVEPQTLEKSLVVEETPASEIKEANILQDSISKELEVNVVQVETPAAVPSGFTEKNNTVASPTNQPSRQNASEGPEFEAKIAKLVELGFSREAVVQALRLFERNEEQAAGFLFGG